MENGGGVDGVQGQVCIDAFANPLGSRELKLHNVAIHTESVEQRDLIFQPDAPIVLVINNEKDLRLQFGLGCQMRSLFRTVLHPLCSIV